MGEMKVTSFGVGTPTGRLGHPEAWAAIEIAAESSISAVCEVTGGCLML